MRRRRGPSFVTKTACTECRKSRAKCDGQKPCARCTSRVGLVCEYGVPVHVRKEDMRQEIKKLRRYRQLSEKVLGLLASGVEPGFVISKLQQHEPLEAIAQQLGRDGPAAESLRSESWSQGRCGSAQIDRSTEGQVKMEDVSDAPSETGIYSFKHGSRWTDVPLSDTVIEQLLLLYFCWEYPIFSTVSKHHFARDFNTGRDRVEARMDPEDGDTAGMHCYLEAESLLSLCRGDPSVTVVQGACLMSTWHASRGDYKKARYYAGQAIRMAVETGLHQDSTSTEIPGDTLEVHNTTFWGAFMLDQAWSLAAGCLPHISQSGVSIGVPTAFDRDELREWIPYAGDQIPKGLDLRQPSNVRGVYASLCELSTIIHGILYVMQADTDPISSKDVLDQYTRMLDWYNSLPKALRLGENSTPSVLFVHMYYHFSIILTFYPLKNFHPFDSSVSAHDICTDAANAVIALVRSFESLHGLRRTPCFRTYIVFAAGMAHLGTPDPITSPVDTLTQSSQEVALLQMMSLYQGSSKRACRVLLSRALYPIASGGAHGEGSEGVVQPPWEPFARTMVWPATRRDGASIEGRARVHVPYSTPLDTEQLRENLVEE